MRRGALLRVFPGTGDWFKRWEVIESSCQKEKEPKWDMCVSPRGSVPHRNRCLTRPALFPLAYKFLSRVIILHTFCYVFVYDGGSEWAVCKNMDCRGWGCVILTAAHRLKKMHVKFDPVDNVYSPPSPPFPLILFSLWVGFCPLYFSPVMCGVPEQTIIHPVRRRDHFVMYICPTLDGDTCHKVHGQKN